MLLKYFMKDEKLEDIQERLSAIDLSKYDFITLNRLASLLNNAIWECNKEIIKRKKEKNYD